MCSADVVSVALLSVYDKAGLLPLAHGLDAAGVQLCGSGGTAKAIRNAGLNIACAGGQVLSAELFADELLAQRCV